MWPDHKLVLSPFAECGITTSQVGYRDASNEMIVASVELPTELIERAVFEHVSFEVTLSGAGEIASVASGMVSNLPSTNRIISIDALVDILLERSNLHMEEVTESELRTLLKRLETSLCAVRRAIAIMNPAASS